MSNNIEQALEKRYYLHRGSSDANTKYLVNATVSDPMYILVSNEIRTAVVRDTEWRQMKRETNCDEVVPFSDFADGDVRDDVTDEFGIILRMLEEKSVESVSVEPEFPSYLTRHLESNGINVDILDENPITRLRETKSQREISIIEDIQQECEEAMEKVKSMLSNAESDESGDLYLGDSELTSQRIKDKIKQSFESDVSWPEGLIVSHGKQTAEPHNRGSGTIQLNEPVVVDIFPQDEYGYFGDMTRTFVKGSVPDDVEHMHRAVSNALESSLDLIESDIDKKIIHNDVCEVLEKYGYSTGSDAEDGFIHATGHGVGLELHELPNLNNKSGNLEKNAVVTVEPGLYIEDIGGVRCEDITCVKENGYENLNSMEQSLIVVD